MSEISQAANLLSTPPSELEQPPANVEAEEQEALVTQEAPTESKKVEQETPKGDTEAEPAMHKVKIDGEEVEVPYDELLKGYSRETHYQKKAKDLAKERETITTKQQQLDELLQDAELLVNDKKAKLNSEELKQLRFNDPDAYLREKEKIEADLAKFEKVKTQRQKDLDAKTSELVAKERELLFDSFPHWRDDEAVMSKEAGEMFKALESLGYKEEELNNIQDHRMFLLAQAKLKLDKIESADLESKQVKSNKNLSPSAKADTTDKDSQQKKAVVDRFKKTGKLKDAALLLST